MMNGKNSLVALVCLCLASAVSADWVQAEWDVMGTRATLEFWPNGQDSAHTIEAIKTEFERLNSLLSPYREDSELYRANQQAAHSPVPVSDEFAALIERSRHYTAITEGAFDITVAAAGLLYNYREGIAPDDQALAFAMAGVGMDKVRIDRDNHLHFAHPATRVDLGGIAKGYAIDRAVTLLRADRVEHAYISLGGDSYALGDRRGRPWQVGIRHPREDKVAISLPLEDVAISTSGDYERFFLRDGQHVHHILQPATGRSASGLVSVTLLTHYGTDADPLATGIFVLGAERGLALANRLPDVSAILIDAQGEVYYTDDLMAAQ